MQIMHVYCGKLENSDKPKEKLNKNHLQSYHLQMSPASSDLCNTKQFDNMAQPNISPLAMQT